MRVRPPLYTGGSWLGAGSEIRTDPLELYQRIHADLGPVVRLRYLPGLEMVSVASPGAMERILRENQANYVKPSLFLRAVAPLMGTGLFTSEGLAWRRQRTLIAPAFHRRHVARMVGIMEEEIERLAERWTAARGATRDVLEDMMGLTLNIVSRALFSTNIMGVAGRISDAVRIAFTYVGYRLNTPFSLAELITQRRRRAFDRAKRILDQTITTMIRERRKGDDPGDDLLGLLLAARDEQTGQGMDSAQLLDELLTLMIAGHETTGAALAWSWILLAENASAAERLRQSVRSDTSRDGVAGDPVSIPPYATWVFEESMRLYPPAWGVPRQAVEADVVEGFDIPKGTIINCAFFAMFRDPGLWERPEEFLPERFEAERVAARPRTAAIPFGWGGRQCVGLNMAMVEGPLVLARLGRRFSLRFPPDAGPVQMDATFALRPKGRLEMKIVGADG